VTAGLAEPPRLVAPAYAHIPDAFKTFGGDVAGMCEEAGFAPFPEQRLALDAIFGRDETGRSVAFESWLICARQNLKTAIMKMSALGWAFLFAEDPIIWTAHEWDPVLNEAFHDLDELIAGYRWMARQVLFIHSAERAMKIGLKNGARILFKTRTRGSARGIAGAKTILDEGWALLATQLGALLPTMAARSMHGDPQILGGSSGAQEDSTALHEVIDRGRAAATDPHVAALERRLFYMEYCAPPPAEACDLGDRCDHGKQVPGCGCDKPELIARANPSVGRLISMDFLLGERRALPVAEWCREAMTWHERPPGESKVIPLTDWAAALDEHSEPAGPVMLSVVYSRNARNAAIGLAGLRADRRWHVEVADEVPPSRVGFRVRQVIARAASEGGRVATPVGVDGNAFEKDCIPELERPMPFDEVLAGLPPLERKRAEPLGEHWPEIVPVRVLNTGDVTAAFTGFRKSLTEAHDLCHRGQDSLTLALMGATSRLVGDAGEAWGRRRSDTDIECIVAATQARWLHEQECPVADVEPGVWSL
jgi:hypothetical protein